MSLLSLCYLQNALLLYHTPWLWLHFLVFDTDNGLHVVFFLLVLRPFPRPFVPFLLLVLSAFCPKVWRSRFLLTTVDSLFYADIRPFFFQAI